MSTSLEDLQFPVLCRSQNLVLIKLTEDELTTCNKLGLKNGWYRGMTVVDSKGTGIKIKDAHKLHGVGLFWGYNVFLNQRIKLALGDFVWVARGVRGGFGCVHPPGGASWRLAARRRARVSGRCTRTLTPPGGAVS